MFGQITRKLVKIALLILYQTHLRTQKSNNHLIIHLTLLNQNIIVGILGETDFSFRHFEIN